MRMTPIAKSGKVAVTFEMPSDIEAQTLAVMGDFNNWDATAAPMKRRKDGWWFKTLRLAPGMYRFRYLADGQVWHNDPAADAYEPSGFGSDNCLLIIK